MDMPITGVIEMPKEGTHNYTITTYYNTLDENQTKDANKTFSYKVSIEGVYKKEINYIEDLVDLSNEVNGGYGYQKTWFVQTRNLDFNDSTTYKDATNTTTYGDYNEDGTIEDIKTELTTGSGFYPIGDTQVHKFSGSYDGQKYRIDHLFINNTKSKDREGLFGWNYGPILSNLTISGSVTSNGDGSIGGITGGKDNGILYNLINEVNVTKTNSTVDVGGITGIVANAYIKNCTNIGTIQGAAQAGGIMGRNYSTVIIENSYNEGEVINNVGTYAAGFVGVDRNSSSITKIYNSHNSGVVSSTNSDGTNTKTGGLVGLISGQLIIEKSYNSGNISRINISNGSNRNISVGGIIGQIFEANNGAVIKNVYNTGIVSGGNRTGGIVGYSYGNTIIDKTYNTGNVTSNFTDSNYIPSIGGITGYAWSNNANYKLYILNSYNTGTISHTGNGNASGITGVNDLPGGLTLINSYNTGLIEGISSASGIGGVRQGSNSYIYNVYNKGTINSDTNKYGILYNAETGSGVLTNAYYLEGITGSNVSGQTGISKTSSEIAGREFVSTLNNNKNAIDLTTEYDGVLADYELSDWKFDSTLGYPVLDN